MSSNISFLLGAGISIPAGLDSTVDLTNKILVGDQIVREASSYYQKHIQQLLCSG